MRRGGLPQESAPSVTRIVMSGKAAAFIAERSGHVGSGSIRGGGLSAPTSGSKPIVTLATRYVERAALRTRGAAAPSRLEAYRNGAGSEPAPSMVQTATQGSSENTKSKLPPDRRCSFMLPRALRKSRVPPVTASVLSGLVS